MHLGVVAKAAGPDSTAHDQCVCPQLQGLDKIAQAQLQGIAGKLRAMAGSQAYGLSGNGRGNNDLMAQVRKQGP